MPDLRISTDLCGTWEFTPAGGATTVIPVPAQWTHGASFGLPVTWSLVRHATYARALALPPHRSGRRLRLRFGAVMLAARVRLDGETLGAHRGGFTPFDIGIPDALWRARGGGLVRLEVEVDSALDAYVDGRCLHQIGYPDDNEEGPAPGGIWQPVTLEELPTAGIAAWRSRWRHATRHLELAIDAERAPASASVRVTIGRGHAAEVATWPLRDGGAGGTLRLPAALAAWSWREPVLHPMRIELLDADGATIDRRDERIGLREVAVIGRELRWNGEPLRMRGLSLIRHRVSPWLWRRDYLRAWFGTLRRLGFNSLRLHAAIAPPVVLEVMDEIGLLAIDQSAVWSTAVDTYNAGGAEFVANTCREYDAWIARDRNHPCIVAWDVENEMCSIDPLRSPPWVERLMAHVRGQTGLPVIASASGALTSSAFIHLHCAQDQHRLLPLPRSHRRPVVLGEWWGPDKVYRDTMRAPNRRIADPAGPTAHAAAIAAFYRREIVLHRLGGVAGTFPFGLEVLLFRPVFASGERLTVPGGPGEPPLLYSELYHRDRNYHVVRRPLINPGWSAHHPRLSLEPALAAAIRAACAPVVAAFTDQHRDAPGGTVLLRRIAIANDSGKSLRCRVRVRLLGPDGRAVDSADLSLAVADGASAGVEARLRLPSVETPTRLRVAATILGAGRTLRCDAELWAWPSPAWLRPGRLPLAVLGVPARLVAHLRRRGLRPQIADTLPATPAVVLAGRLPPSLAPAAVSAFLAIGGRLILLRQEADPAAIPLPLRLRSADESIHPVYHGIRTSTTQLSWLAESSFTDPAHPVCAGLPAGGLRPFAAGDHRLADHAWIRPGAMLPPHTGPFRVLATGGDRSQAVLVEIPGATGLVLACQFCLAENAGRDPQADRLLANLLAHADAWQPPVAAWRCSAPELAQRLAALSGSGGTDEPGPGLRIATDPAEARRLLAALDDPRHAENRRLRAGGRLLVLAAPGLRLPGLEARSRPPGDLLCAPAGRWREPLGWSSLDLDPLCARPDLAVLRCATPWRELVRVAPQDPAGQYAGFWVDPPCGAVLAMRRIGAGAAYVTGLPLATAADRRGDLLWLLALTALEAPLPRAAILADDLVPARLSPPLPCAGDVLTWACTEADVNIAPWSCARAVAIDERHLVRRGGDAPEPSYTHGALFRVLHDRKHLLVSAQVLATTFDFTQAETRLYRTDSIEVRVGDAWICATRGADGRLFVTGSGTRDDAGLSRRITGTLTLRPATATGPDRTLLRLDRTPEQEAFYELRIPLDLLPIDPAPDAPPTPFALAFNAPLDGPVKRLNCSFPADYGWNDRTSWGRLRLVEDHR